MRERGLWEDFSTKLPAALQSGEGPDVALMHVEQIPTNAAHGTILPLDGLVRDLGLREDDFAAPAARSTLRRAAGGRAGRGRPPTARSGSSTTGDDARERREMWIERPARGPRPRAASS
jgi:hypothetical protein